MRRLKNYIIPALYNIRHNPSFALFYVLGTALTFVFITITLQLLYSFVGNVPPLDKGDRIVSITDYRDTKGNGLGGIYADYTNAFMEGIRGHEMYARTSIEEGHVFAGEGMVSQVVNFVNADYWKVFQFEFLEGRAFGQQEYEGKQPVAVINRNVAELLFKQGSAVGQKIEFQRTTYTVTGVVENVSFFTTMIADGVWVSDQFNTFTPSGHNYYEIFVLFPLDYSMTEAKGEVARAVKTYYEGRGREVDISVEKVSTRQEDIIRLIGNGILSYGIPVIVFLLLLVPAINILTLSVANSNRQSEEIAIRRAIGASRFVLFSFIVVENFLLVLIGVVIGLLLVFPTIHLVEYLCFEDSLLGNMSFLTRLDFVVIAGGVLPLSILFTLLTSVLPARLALQRNMAEVLKGGSK